MSKRRRNFSDDFKSEAVSLVEGGYRSRKEIARSLDIHQSLLDKWVALSRRESLERAAPQDLTLENKRLEKENRRLRMELEFLKKVSRYFAGEQS